MRLLERFEIFKGAILTESWQLASDEGRAGFHDEAPVVIKAYSPQYISNERIKMKINIKDFLVSEGKKVKLEKWPTQVKPLYHSKEIYKELLDKQREELSAQQQLHYASNR